MNREKLSHPKQEAIRVKKPAIWVYIAFQGTISNKYMHMHKPKKENTT